MKLMAEKVSRSARSARLAGLIKLVHFGLRPRPAAGIDAHVLLTPKNQPEKCTEKTYDNHHKTQNFPRPK